MNNTFIHIGYPKTASTFVQQELFNKLEELVYLMPPHTQHNEDWNKMQYADDSNFELSNFDSELQKYRNTKDILISDEGLVGKPIYGGMHRSVICNRLKQTFPEAQILIVVRGQFDMLKSLHNQYVKGARKGTKTFGDFVWWKKMKYDPNAPFSLDNMYHNTNADYVHVDFLKYYETIELYKNTFKNVTVLPYELIKIDAPLFIKKVRRFLGRDTDNTTINYTAKNKSVKQKDIAKLIVENSIFNLNLSKVEKQLLKIRKAKSIRRKNSAEYMKCKPLIAEIYRENNQRIIDKYPEIGIQNYKEFYF